MTTTFPFELFSETLISFCSSSYSHSLSEKVRITKEHEIQLNQKNIWIQSEVIVPSEVKLSDGSLIKFKYNHQLIKFNQSYLNNVNYM